MTHTNEFLMGMHLSYYGAKYKLVKHDGVWRLLDVSIRHDQLGLLSDSADYATIELMECKPILTPLSEITDSDAVEVAKIMTVATNCDWVGAGKNETIRFLHLLIIGNKENNDYDDNVALGSGVVKQIIDYLRLKHYDCGYMHIQSLIKDGLAIAR